MVKVYILQCFNNQYGQWYDTETFTDLEALKVCLKEKTCVWRDYRVIEVLDL